MRNLKSYTLFESSRFLDFKNKIEDLKDICQEFEDNGLNYIITPSPSDEIRLNLLSMQLSIMKRSLSNYDFYIVINTYGLKTVGLPEWFIENCKRIEYFMLSINLKTLPSINRPAEEEFLENVDDLSDVSGLIKSVKLVFLQI